MVSISFLERGLRGERSQTCPYMLSAKQGSIWYHFYNVFGMTRSEIEPTTSRLRANALTTEPPLRKGGQAVDRSIIIKAYFCQGRVPVGTPSVAARLLERSPSLPSHQSCYCCRCNHTAGSAHTCNKAFCIKSEHR